MATIFNLNDAPFNDDTTPEQLELIRILSEEHPQEYERILEDYCDDPAYTEYRLIVLASEYYG